MTSMEINNDRRESTSSVRSGFVYGLSDGNWFGFVLNPATEWSNGESQCASTSRIVDPLTRLDENGPVIGHADETESPTQDRFRLSVRRPTSEHRGDATADDRRASICTHVSSTASSNGLVTPRHSIPGSSVFKDRYLASLQGPKEKAEVMIWLDKVNAKK